MLKSFVGRLRRAVLTFRAPPPFVFQMGKVGSTTLMRNLEHRWPGLVVRSHTLNRAQKNRSLDVLRFVHMPLRRPVLIVTPIREPIARNVSAFFENLGRYVADPSRPPELGELQRLFLERYNHDIPLEWFDRQMRVFSGIDVFATPFPADGYFHLQSGNCRALIYRVELEDSVKSSILGEFLGLDKFDLIRANHGDAKPYADLYRSFRASFAPPSDYLKRMHESRYYRHFYQSKPGGIGPEGSELPRGRSRLGAMSAPVIAVMFHTGRCGSTVLARMLAQHPSITWEEEVLTRLNQSTASPGAGFARWSARLFKSTFGPHAYWSLRARRSRTSVYGFEIKTYPVEKVIHFRSPLEEVITEMESRGISKFIALRRRNLLRSYVSSLRATRSGIWHVSTDTSVAQTGSVALAVAGTPSRGPGNLLAYLDSRTRTNDKADHLVEQRGGLLLRFEDHIAPGPELAYQLVSDYLGTEFHRADVPLTRVNPQPLAEIVSNYTEVAELLRPTDYSWMLED